MGTWPRSELEQAFAHYQATARVSAETGDWNPWADLFTEDAEYIEHLYGTMQGREEIRAWISKTMSSYPGNAMVAFPVEWSTVDTGRGWVVCQIWNRMADPGDGSVHQAYNFTLLKYAGDGLWSSEEDIYNPAHFVTMITAWEERKTQLAGADGSS
jgi:SnoaL-like domain